MKLVCSNLLLTYVLNSETQYSKIFFKPKLFHALMFYQIIERIYYMIINGKLIGSQRSGVKDPGFKSGQLQTCF